MRKNQVEKNLVKENGQFVWMVTDGKQVKFAWPRDGKDSLTVADEMIANW